MLKVRAVTDLATFCNEDSGSTGHTGPSSDGARATSEGVETLLGRKSYGERRGSVTSFELSLGIAQRTHQLNRQGVPVFMGSQPLQKMADLEGADVAIVGIPYVSPLLGYENDIAPRKVRIAGLTYWSTYVPELDIDPAESLAIVDCGDVDFPFGDTGAAVSAVETVVGEVLEAGG